MSEAITAVEEARAVLAAMKESQPGPHIEILEKGFAVLYNAWAGARFDALILAKSELIDPVKLMMLGKTPRTGEDWAKLFGITFYDLDGWNQEKLDFSSSVIDRGTFVNLFSVSATLRIEPWSPLHV